MSIHHRRIGVPIAAALLALVAGGLPGVGAEPTPAAVVPVWPGASVTTSPMAESDVATLDTLANAVLAQSPDLPGLWVGIWDPARGYATRAYGKAAIDGQAATPEDHGRIGSVTKTFTVTAILQQVAAGTLALDDTVAKILPDLAAAHPAIADITVSQLAGMQSGIPDYANTGVVLQGVVADPTRVWTATDLIDAALTLPLQPPGTGGYSTTNTQILGLMLEQRTGMPVESVIADLLAQAGLTQSALRPGTDSSMPAPSSRGYVNAPGVASLTEVGVEVPTGTDVTDWTASWGGAGGGMYSTVADLGAWAATGLGSSLLPEELASQRLAFAPIPGGRYGLGLFDWGGGWVGHTGQIIGWESLVGYNTGTGAAIVIMVNETGSLLSGEALALQWFPDLIGLVGG